MLTRNADPGRDEYFELVRAFPLRPLRDDADLAEASKIIDALLGRGDRSQEAEDYLEVLSDIVEKYEHEHHPINPPKDHVVLEQLLLANQLSQAEFARQTAIATSTVSAVLSGERRLTRTQIGVIAKRFGVSPNLFAFAGED